MEAKACTKYSFEISYVLFQLISTIFQERALFVYIYPETDTVNSNNNNTNTSKVMRLRKSLTKFLVIDFFFVQYTRMTIGISLVFDYR